VYSNAPYGSVNLPRVQHESSSTHNLFSIDRSLLCISTVNGGMSDTSSDFSIDTLAPNAREHYDRGNQPHYRNAPASRRAFRFVMGFILLASLGFPLAALFRAGPERSRL
jgi:hypothetical protein